MKTFAVRRGNNLGLRGTPLRQYVRTTVIYCIMSAIIFLALSGAGRIPLAGSQLRTLLRQGTGATLDVGVTLGGALLLREYCMDARYIPSESMQPTFEVGDMLLLDKLTLRARPPGRGDVVCFTPPPAMIERLPQLAKIRNVCMIKRVVALPGDVVRVRDGKLLINGQIQREPYVSKPATYRMRKHIVPEGHVFVLGDNRDESCDSHVWGYLEQRLLIGIPLCTYWPPRRVRRRRAYRGMS